MTKKYRIIYLICFLILLFALNYGLTKTVGIPTGNSSIWFHAGLLMIILGTYWIEPYFTRPTDVAVNSLIVFISISMLNNPPLSEWWNILKYLSAFLMILSLLVFWAGSPVNPEHDTSKFKKYVYMLITRLGKAEVLFSLVFVLSLLSYFDLKTNTTRWMVLFWGVVLITKHLNIDGIINYFRQKSLSEKLCASGITSRIAEPNIVRFKPLKDKICRIGHLVAFTKKGKLDEKCPIALVTGIRTSPDSVEAESIIIDPGVGDIKLEEKKIVVRVEPNDPVLSERLSGNHTFNSINKLIAFAIRRTEISRLFFEITKRQGIEEGHLVSVRINDGKDILFQVINGKLDEETSIERSERSYTIGEAEQIGTWDDNRQGFETYSWVIPENSPVFHIEADYTVHDIAKKDLVSVGKIPNSSINANVNIKDLVLYHSAILGVTGSGKTFLAFHMIEECIKKGIKVICLDITGDYQRFIKDVVLIKTTKGVEEFLAKEEYRIGVIEFTEDGNMHPINIANEIANRALEWCMKSRKENEIKEPTPKVLLVMEEAHVLVPEWNSNPARNLQDTVVATSKIALQARKYGLGFMIITQRTANVTKSILNQCNTIFAFQAFDETGFDFMKNYMGVHYVNALPNLKKRQGVIVGKASTSDRPIIVRFHDQDREATTGTIPVLPKEHEENTSDSS